MKYKSDLNSILELIYNSKIGDRFDIKTVREYLNLMAGQDDIIYGKFKDIRKTRKDYKLLEVDIDLIKLEKKYLLYDRINIFLELYENTGKYPPLVLNSRNFIIDGSHRLEAIKKLGFKKVKVIKPV